MKTIFSFDAETNGLYGQPFCISAIIYSQEMVEIDKFLGRCEINGDIDLYVKENILPSLTTVCNSHDSYAELLIQFSKFYKKYIKALKIGHLISPVESNVLADMMKLGLIKFEQLPMPFIDVSGMLLMAGENPCSVDEYAAKYNLFSNYSGNTHNPLYDCDITAIVYKRLLSRNDTNPNKN